MARTVIDYIDLGEKHLVEVRAEATGAYGEYRLQVVRDGQVRNLGFIQRDTDRVMRQEWVVEDIDFKQIGLYPTLGVALTRASHKILAKEAHDLCRPETHRRCAEHRTHPRVARRNDWGDLCPGCGVKFPVLHGAHPTWLSCQPSDEE